MSSKPRILVLSASTGNGHTSAADAIVAQAQAMGLHAVHEDVLDFTSKGFRKWYRGGYETLVRRRPKMWGHLYRSSDRPRFNYYFQTGLDRKFCRPLAKIIRSHKPDWVICTHSLPQPALAQMRAQYPFRMGVVVTDLYVHRMWLRGKPDWFFVPQEYSRNILAQRLPSVKDQITVSGIPVHPVFESAPRKEDARAQLEIEDSAELALVSSGGIGGGPLLEAVEALRIQGLLVTVIAGRNDAMRTALKNRFQDDSRVNVLGHIDQATMAKHMAAADFLVAKPGGLTTFEALTVGLPFLVYWPFLIPGQEEGNADFLEECGAGVIARNINELESQANILKDPVLRDQMSRAAKAHAPSHSAEKIVQQIITLSSQE